MPPKGSGKDKDLTDEDEVLQAVILADSFNKRFKPLTSGKPRCLLPVCNATLLDWTFESLALAGVQEIFVVCRSYPELVKAAIRDSKWSKPSLGLKIVPIITSKETFTPGDAMRDIYTRGIITSDFVLVMGDLVSNIRIDEVVKAHKERRKTNKDAIMMMVVKPSGPVHRTRSKGESAVFVLDAETQECLHYEHVTGYPPKKHIKIPREILTEHPEVEIRYDLIDCSIDVCSVEVPSLFQDNFDYGDIRRDFVHGILTSDLLAKNIHCYIASDGYAARVADTRSYDSVSKDILARWTFPLVPDDNHPGGHSYEHLRGNKYVAKGNSVVLSRTCKIGSNSLVGAHSRIADNANIQASVIGQRCIIDANVTLRNAYVFDDTHIGAGSVIEYSIIGSNVKVSEGSTVARGCLVGDGVILGKGAKLDEFERVSRRKDEGERSESDEEDEEEEQESEDSELDEFEQDPESLKAILGEDSNAVLWPKGPRENDDELDEVERYDNQRLMRIGDPATDLVLVDEGTDSDEGLSSDSESDTDFHTLSRISSRTSTSGPDGILGGGASAAVSTIHNLQAAAAYSEFQNEVTQSLDRAFVEGHSVDNAAVELKTLRMASNVPLRKVREAVVAALVERIELVEGDPARQRREIGKMVQRWGPLIDRIGGVDPVETVEVLQYHCAKSSRLPLFGQILAALYQEDIVEEDDIRTWHARPEAKGEHLKDASLAENVKRCWSVAAKLIQQFDEQESSEEEAEEGSEEEPTSTAQTSKSAAKKESSSEEESGSGSGSGSGEDESEEDESDEEPPIVSPNAQSQAIPVAPKSAPTQVKEESESEEEESEEGSEEDSEEDPAPSAKLTAATASPSLAAVPSSSPSSNPTPALKRTPGPPHAEESSEEESGSEEPDSEDGDEEEEEEKAPVSQAPTLSAQRVSGLPHAQDTQSSRGFESGSEGTEDEDSEEEESEEDTGSHATTATEPVHRIVQGSSSTGGGSAETLRQPEERSQTSQPQTKAQAQAQPLLAVPVLPPNTLTIQTGPTPSGPNSNRSQTSIPSTTNTEPQPPSQPAAAVPRPRPAAGSGGGGGGSAGGRRESMFRRHSIHFGDKFHVLKNTDKELGAKTKRVVTMAGRQVKKGIRTILRRGHREDKGNVKDVKEKT